MQHPFMLLGVHDSHGVIVSLKGCACAYVCVLWCVLFKMDGAPLKKLRESAQSKSRNKNGICLNVV